MLYLVTNGGIANGHVIHSREDADQAMRFQLPGEVLRLYYRDAHDECTHCGSPAWIQCGNHSNYLCTLDCQGLHPEDIEAQREK